MHQTYTILSPTKGALVALEQVPDPVFGQKILGDGIAIDPSEGIVRAPISGHIINFNLNLHAFVIENNGLEILVHVGIDTVRLRGDGFTPLVTVGDTVSAGQPVLKFDLERICSSLETPLVLCVVTAPSSVTICPTKAETIQAQDLLFTVEIPHVQKQHTSSTDTISATVTINHEHGLHARPAGLIARLAGTYPYEVMLCKQNGQCANAKSIVGIMSLALNQGEEITIQLKGPQKQAIPFLHKLKNVLESPTQEQPSANLLKGQCIYAGVVAGPAQHWQTNEPTFEEITQDPQADWLLLKTAIQSFITRTTRSLQTLPSDTREVLETQLDFAKDPTLLEESKKFIFQGKSAGYAFYHAVEESLVALQRTRNPLIQQRQADLRDLRRQILFQLNGQTHYLPSIQPGCILLAEDLLPSDIAHLHNKAAGVLLSRGSATSHAGILLKNLSIVSLAQLGPELLQIPNGTALLVDAAAQQVQINPAKVIYQTHATVVSKSMAVDARPAYTKDDIQIIVSGSVGSLQETQLAAKAGADGLGLVRSEILFANHEQAPTQEEQYSCYQQLASLFKYPVTFRLWDAGADKPLPFFKFSPQPNPMLGIRGIRAYQANQDLFMDQIRALLRVQTTTPLRILLPMVTHVDEFNFFKKLCIQEQQTIRSSAALELGAMVEIPSAALQAEQLARQVDFLSIGTNDLIQYTLAMDRAMGQFTQKADVLDPAVLKLINATCQHAIHLHVPLAVCGEAAHDLQALPILLGLGVREVAVPATYVAAVKQQIRQLSIKRCSKLAQKALTCENAIAVRRLLQVQTK